MQNIAAFLYLYASRIVLEIKKKKKHTGSVQD